MERVVTDSKSTRKIAGSIMVFVLPYFLNMLVQNLYGAVDLFVVGHFGGNADTSGVTVGSQIMNMLTQLIIGFATAVTVMTGRFFGAKKDKEMAKTFGSSVTMFAVIAVVIFAVLVSLLGPIVSVMNTPAEAVEKAQDYLFICAFGLFFIAGYNIIASVMMGMGNTKTPFFFICIACVINVGLDFLLVAGLKMGARGAAIATVAAQVGCFVIAVIYLAVKGFGFKLEKSAFRPSSATIRRLLVIGAPTAVQNVLVGASFLFITATINKLGLAASAAVGVVEKLITFLMMPAMAFSASVSALSSQYLGADDRKSATKVFLLAIALSLVPSAIFTVFTFFFPGILTPIFSADPEVIALAAEYLRSYGLDIILVAFLFPINGFLASNGFAWFSLIHNLVATFGFRIPLTTIFSAVEGTTLFTIGWAAPLSTVVSLVLCAVFFAVLYFVRKKRAAVGADERPQ